MRFNDEGQLKDFFFSKFKKDFTFFSEVPGEHLESGKFKGKKIRVDFLLKPKKHLIEKGFSKGCFGVEVKHFPDTDGGFRKKAVRLFTQAKRYFKSSFVMDGEIVLPNSIFIFSNLAFESERKIIMKGDRQAVWEGMTSLASRDGIGEFLFFGLDNQNWKIFFGGGLYFSYYLGKYQLNNPHTLGEKWY